MYLKPEMNNNESTEYERYTSKTSPQKPVAQKDPTPPGKKTNIPENVARAD